MVYVIKNEIRIDFPIILVIWNNKKNELGNRFFFEISSIYEHLISKEIYFMVF